MGKRKRVRKDVQEAESSFPPQDGLVRPSKPVEAKDVTQHHRAYYREESFGWMMKKLIAKMDTERIKSFMLEHWKMVYGTKPLPTGDVRANDLYRLLQYELLALGHKKAGVPLNETLTRRLKASRFLLEDRKRAMKLFGKSAELFDYQEVTEFGKLLINFNFVPQEKKEIEMAAKKRATEPKKTKKKVAAKAKPVEKKTVAKKPAKKVAGKKASEKKKDEAKPAAKSTKKLTAASYAVDLLVEKKYTDAQIIKMVKKKFPDYAHADAAPKFYRSKLKSGSIKRIGALELKEITK